MYIKSKMRCAMRDANVALKLLICSLSLSKKMNISWKNCVHIMHDLKSSLLLRLPQNIAGVTILAFGNGAPDIFSALASVQQQRPELLIGALFGAGVFVTTAVTGAICLSKPFKLMERPFLRDVTFYLAAGFWAFCIFYR